MANQLNLTPKYEQLQKLIESDVDIMITMCPHILGETYEELARNLLALKEAGKTIKFAAPHECSRCSEFERNESKIIN